MRVPSFVSNREGLNIRAVAVPVQAEYILYKRYVV